VSAAVYARVSTLEQTTDAQVDALRSYCLARGLGEPAVFRDDGISGVRDNRPQLDALREQVRRGQISAVVVTKVDRLGRSLGMILRFWDEADAAGVRVIVTDQGIDTSTATGRLQRNMLAALAEFERELILERTQAGIARARAAGKRFGRPPKITDDRRAECFRRLSNGER
jgi:DNA invertase Pin-like site-specific DNA recombinase